MSGVKWTDEQQKVIDTRERNLLVSAAAGSGKTAVLVERIIQMITDEEKPVDIDRLLVVTFTNAAASEMRERISEALEKKIDNNPENRYLHKQLSLLPNASIMTIHAFCLQVIKNNFHMIQVDPSFRVADETELTLLKSDIVKELLESYYQKDNNDEFLALIESYATGKSDDRIESLIMELHKFAMSNPWPVKWLKEMADTLHVVDEKDLDDKVWTKMVTRDLEQALPMSIRLLEECLSICQEEGGPIGYEDAIALDLKHIKSIYHQLQEGYQHISQEIMGMKFGPIGRCKKGVDPIMQHKVKAIREDIKESFTAIQDQYFFKAQAHIAHDIDQTYPVIEALVDLVITFMENYKEAKAEKNMIDFNDIEHYALNILVTDNEEGEKVPSSAAIQLQDRFSEILIDEYQDSNLVQETILTSVSKIHQSMPNVFMVGDVKQSIYKFRLAKPELFMEKYKTYSTEESKYQKIDLHRNFRSRENILDCTNYLFSQLMSLAYGDVVYDEHAALHLGAPYKPCEEGIHAGPTELILIDHEEVESDEIIESKEVEAKVIAGRIKELMNPDEPYYIYDKKNGIYRPAMYKDIVILMRSTSTTADMFVETLGKYDIPAYTDASTGYFDTVEIRTILSLLKIIDNPRQDIPLLSVLRSPIVGLKADELVRIKTQLPEGEFYDAYEQYIIGTIDEDDLSQKLTAFHEQLTDWREKAVYMPLHELILHIYEVSHYYNFISVMTGGRQRQANLDLLVDKAIRYESTSYKGLFNFIRYLEKIHKYAIDMGEASIFGESENLVRIMSIHKSKGLEFPVVFVAGMGKQFNMQDLNKPILLHQDLGFGPKYVNYELRYETKTLPRSVISKQIKNESLSEELRILYVALTRAREKLILVGSCKDIHKKIEKVSTYLFLPDVTLPNALIGKGRSYLDWIIPAILRHADGETLRACCQGLVIQSPEALYHHRSFWEVTCITPEQTIEKEEVHAQERMQSYEALTHWASEVSYSDYDKDYFDKQLNWVYPAKDAIARSVKVSVSEIKRQNMLLVQEEHEELFHDFEPYKPAFMEEKIRLTPGERGTVFHKVMQHIDFNRMDEQDYLVTYCDQLERNGMLTEKEKKSVSIQALLRFSDSDLIKRMINAEKQKQLKREMPFVLGINAQDIYDACDLKETILVQGVIDCYFLEHDEIVLVDYKTDYIKPHEEQVLIDRYKKQMELYCRALENISGFTVKEVILYAFSIGQEIKMDPFGLGD
ncbi:helicase-exonuclease AddAB subunit AddA [Vallitalea pronyensis]|uniref:ATP-dependent helicase/nuclease subunit A n=1 Tax=Vallitalea pronyensis TaxID=1348613 RepID=A0A8J8MP00_9FIRM|nr:helicase-exonuclease AddAB subunit AddA [Vallitalea pronyensis]QUI24723.1 helicase-exonuclease AddAB subunit AddA [Vallitalea pronyensis]